MKNLKSTCHIPIMSFRLFSEASSYSWKFCRALVCPRAKLAVRLLAAESQLALCRERIRQRKDPRPRFTPAFRMLWVLLSKVVDGWEDLAQLMQPATVK